MPNIKIQTTTELSVPKGTKVITNNEYITLARKSNGNLLLFTCQAEDIHSYDLNNNDIWMEFTKAELKKAAEL